MYSICLILVLYTIDCTGSYYTNVQHVVILFKRRLSHLSGREDAEIEVWQRAKLPEKSRTNSIFGLLHPIPAAAAA